ncbi:MAG: adenylosuccinate synthase [Phycisphaeraceae bacterium]|nr:MAG: adenylosuccinate synthase [Phycisphaeraceae bacterium]
MTPAPTPVCTAVVGLQWGDEGKGKIVDRLAAEHHAVVRYNGGANAGHSVVVKGERYALHLIPSGILYPGKLAVIGNGVVVDPDWLLKELDGLSARGVDASGLVLSSRAHVVMPYHKDEDGIREDVLKHAGSQRPVGSGEGQAEIGTTKRGIGPAYAEKVQRATAVRVGDLLRPEALKAKIDLACALKAAMLRDLSGGSHRLDPGAILEHAARAGQRLAPMVRDTTYLLHGLLADGKSILFESANGTLLDVDHGTYPFVTGSSCAVAGIGVGTGVPVQRLSRVVGVMKAYSTRVGSGPLPTELSGAVADRIRTRGREFGTTTGRPRRVGWLDLVAVKYSAMINGATEIAMTLLDVLAGFDELRVCTAYEVDGVRTDRFIPDADLARATPVLESLPGFGEEITACRRLGDLPAPARRYIDFIQAFTGVRVATVSVGPDREQTIDA